MPGDSRLKPSTQRAFGSRKKRAWNKKAPATSAPSAAELESRPDPLDLPGTSTDDTVGPSSTSETLRVDAAYYSTAEQAQRVERSAQTKTVLSGKSATQRNMAEASAEATTSGQSTTEASSYPNFFTWQLTDPFKVERYLIGLSLANCTPQLEQEFYSSPNFRHDNVPVPESEDLKVSTVMCCSLCGAEFETRDEQVQHYKADWHREETDADKAESRRARMNPKVYLKNGDGQVLALSESLLHKTFHSYTVRAKQGGSQSARDGKQKGSQPKSAGASLRRHNEMTLVKDIQDLLQSWSEELQKCSAVFYRAPGANRAVLFSGKNPPFRKSDPRMRPIPFPTNRATYKEVQRVHRMLCTVECFGTLQFADDKMEDDSGSDSDATVNWEVSEEVMDFSDLREFAGTRKPRKKKRMRKKGNKDPEHAEKPVPREFRALKTALFDACKAANKEALTSILEAISGTGSKVHETAARENPETAMPDSAASSAMVADSFVPSAVGLCPAEARWL
ncbi:hypothetical protein HPB52_017182 [Rhipicephalus sanguineus]|uniref:VLRF1 domain-containing protein n=1 Tax=Rhipicephalus sanguineus TaxID=34632 RepID=A0A9D4SZC2_RHISA|nr:hypothetical protein HPB52_017182 [Rhipicephalus sanguineus]